MSSKIRDYFINFILSAISSNILTDIGKPLEMITKTVVCATVDCGSN